MLGSTLCYSTLLLSCRPPGIRKGFIKGKAVRPLRTNSSKVTSEQNIMQFKRRLGDRGYPDNLLESTLSEIKFSERMSALQNEQKRCKRTLPFATEYRPSVPYLKNILMTKWQLIQNQPLLGEIYKDHPLLSFRKGRSLVKINILILTNRSRVWPVNHLYHLRYPQVKFATTAT